MKGLNFTGAKEHYGHEYNVKTGKIDVSDGSTTLTNVIRKFLIIITIYLRKFIRHFLRQREYGLLRLQYLPPFISVRQDMLLSMICRFRMTNYIKNTEEKIIPI